MDTQTQKLMFSSKSNEWETSQDFFDKLNKKYKFTLDPCATHENHKCDKYYTIEDNGLAQSWESERVFVNPPYADIGKWVEKAYKEATKNSAVVVLLIPSRTDTKYWHNYIMKSASTIYFVKGRLKFSGTKNTAPFPSAVVVFGGFRFSPGPRIATLEK